MNLKKLVVTVVAALTATMAFAQSPISEEELFQLETQQVLQPYFQEFSQRITSDKATDADKAILQVVDDQVYGPVKQLGAFLVELQKSEEGSVSDEELDATLGPIEDSLQLALGNLTDTIVHSLDYNKINDEGPATLKRTVSLLVGMGTLDLDTEINWVTLTPENINKEAVSMAGFMSALGYLTQSGKLTEEEMMLIVAVLFEGAMG